MFCGQCGTRNEKGSLFCESCGGKLRVPRQGRQSHHPRRPRNRNIDDTVLVSQVESDYESDMISQNGSHKASDYHSRAQNNDWQGMPSDGQGAVYRGAPPRHQGYGHQNNAYGNNAYQGSVYSGGNSRKKGRKSLIIVGCILLLAAISLAGWIFVGGQNTRAFNDAMDEGNRYLLAENLEQAEAHFLRAIEIRPREVEPYLQLADIYMTWDEPEEAIAILEQGLEAVPESDRPALEEALDEIYETIGVERPVVDEATEDAPPDVPEEIDPFYMALIAFHEFLSNPQTMEFDLLQWQDNRTVSWNLSTLRHAQLVDFNGDGIPELLIILPQTEEFQLCRPFAIIGYSGQIDVLYRSIIWGDGGQTMLYELATTSDGKNYLSSIDRFDIGDRRDEKITYTLVNGEMVPVLATISYSVGESVNGEWIQTIESTYVNGEPVGIADFERAAYEYLGIIEECDLRELIEEPYNPSFLLRYIEDRLEAAGIVLSEHIADAVDEEQREEQRETEGSGNPFNLDVWGSNHTLRIGSSGVTIDAPIPSRADLQERGYRFVLFGEGSGGGWWYRVDVQIGNDNSTLDAINRYINWVANRDCTIEMSHETYVLEDLRLATMDVRRLNDEGREMINATYVISFEHEGQVVVAHINFAGNFNDARKEPFFRAYGIDRFIRAGLL